MQIQKQPLRPQQHGAGQVRLSPSSILAPALGGKFVLTVEGSARKMHWRSVISSNTGMRLHTVDQHVQGSLVVVIQPSSSATRLEARVSIQVLDHNRWIAAGAEAGVAQSPAPPSTVNKPLHPVNSNEGVIPGRTQLQPGLLKPHVAVARVPDPDSFEIPGRSSLAPNWMRR